MKTTMKIGIIGHGHVGSAVHESFRLPGYRWRDQVQVHVVDPGYNDRISFDALLQENVNAIFLCVPTPTKDGKCDASLVLEFVKRLASYDGLLIVKSTVPPSIAQAITELRPRTLICPEFVRENQPGDMLYPTVIPVGCWNKVDFEAYEDLLTTHSNIVVHGVNGSMKTEWTTPIAAAYLKYYVNAFLAMKVAFTHEFVRGMGDDAGEWAAVARLVGLEGRCGKTHLAVPGRHGWGYAGSCFPKDTEALLAEVPGLSILKAVVKANDGLRTENQAGTL